MREEFKRGAQGRRFEICTKRVTFILLTLAILIAFSSASFTSIAAPNECEDYARQLGIDEEVVSILSWLCLDGVMDEREKEFIELLAKLAPELQWDLANKLAIDGQISESNLAEVRAILNTPINSFEPQEEIETWGTGDGAVLEQAELYATEGCCSGKVSFFSGEERWAALWLDSKTLKVTDWSSYYAIGLDVYNPQEESFFLEYHIADEDGSNFWPDFLLAPGMNHLRIYIDDLKKGISYKEVKGEWVKESGEIDTHHIEELRFYLAESIPEIYESPQPNGPILYFDNLRLIPRVEALEAESLLKNGGFEDFSSGWRFPRDPGVTWEFDRQDPLEGSLSVRATSTRSISWNPGAGPEGLASWPMGIIPGEEYTFSIWLKGNQPHLRARLSLDAWGFSDPHWYKNKQFCVSTFWEKYEFTWVIPEGVLLENKARVFLNILGEGTLWADGADFRVTHVREAVVADYAKPANPLFYLPFDGTASAQVAQGDRSPIEQEGSSYVEGIKGQAVMVDNKDMLSYSTLGNLNKEMGSIEMWVTPNWSTLPHIKEPHGFFLEDGPYTCGSDAIYILKDDWPFIQFNVNDSEGHDLNMDISRWRKDEWHQLVFTWDHRVGTRIYIDGIAHPTSKISYYNNFTFHIQNYDKMYVGVSGYGSPYMRADAAIDEFRIYDRPLNREEIRVRYVKFIPVDFYIEHSVFKAREPAEIALVLTNNKDEQITGALRYELVAPSGDIVAQGKKEEISIEAEGKTTLQIAFQPEEEGEYLLNLFWNGETSYKRSLMLFAMKGQRDDPPSQAGLKLKLVEEIDPTEMTSPDRYVDDGTARIVHSSIGSYREAGEEKFSSFAYRFRIEHPQLPYLIVVEYPDDRERIFDIVLDTPHKRDHCLFGCCWDVQTGVYTGDEYPLTNTLQKHRIIFWPREEDNALVFLSWAKGEPAAVSKITIYEIKGGLPELEVNPPKDEPQRLLGLWWEDPSLPFEFGNLDMSFPQLYQTFTRLMEYLKYTGQNLIVYPVAFYTGPFYPSNVEPAEGHERRLSHPGDWIELLLKVAEDNDVYFIPSLTLRLLPSLMQEANTDEDSVRVGEDTINLISCNGRINKNIQDPTPCDPNPDYIPGPVFDPIYPEVQERILALVDELLERYGDFPAFKGISFNLWHDTFLWFGSLDLGYGDYDVNLFEEETGIDVPGAPPDPERFQKRCASLTQGDPDIKGRWINWRCQKIFELFAKIQRKIQQTRGDLRLILSAWMPYAREEKDLRDWNLFAIEGGKSVYDMYKEGGVDIDLYRNVSNLWIEKVWGVTDYRWKEANEEYSPRLTLARDIIFDEGTLRLFDNQEKAAVAMHNGIMPNGYFEFAGGAEQPLPGYWWEPVSWRASAITPAHNYFMEYYAHALASFDATQIGNGGLTIGTMGHEEQIQQFARAYRALPAKHFSIYEQEVTEPVQIRELWEPEKDRYWFYLINRGYSPVRVDLTFDSLGTLTDLATGQKIQAKDGRLSLEIGPYELRSFLATSAAAKIISAQVTLLNLMGKE